MRKRDNNCGDTRRSGLRKSLRVVHIHSSWPCYVWLGHESRRRSIKTLADPNEKVGQQASEQIEPAEKSESNVETALDEMGRIL